MTSNTNNVYQEHFLTASTSTIEKFNKHYVPSNIHHPSLIHSRDYEEVDVDMITYAIDIQHQNYDEVDFYQSNLSTFENIHYTHHLYDTRYN